MPIKQSIRRPLARRRTTLFSALAVALLAAEAQAWHPPPSMFLNIAEIEGDATEPNYENSIEVLSFNQGSSRVPGSPLINLQPITISKATDGASKGLVSAGLADTRSLADWKLSFLQDYGPFNDPELIMTLQLCDVFVSSYSASTAGQPLFESVTFSYGGYLLGVPIRDADGGVTGEMKYTYPEIDDYRVSCEIPYEGQWHKDSDGDGLSDATERALGTNAFDVDTDGDGLVDGQGGWVYVGNYSGGVDANGDGRVDGEADFGTNPLNADTDGDTFSDGVEIAAGSDPRDGASRPPDPFIPGDLNDDGLVDLADLLLGSKLLRGDLVLTPQYLERGDVAPLVGGASSPDGMFDLGDLLIIQSWILKP
jgi:type VI protein secretion system component Hcp